MTDEFVKEQVRIIHEATEEAAKSKESAIRFLEEAGIIKKQKKSTLVVVASGKPTKKK